MAFGRLEITYADGRTAVVELTKRQMVLGRASDADVPIHDTLVSRRHATLFCGPEGVRLRDDGSANGTFLGNSRLPAQEFIPLPDGAELRVGHTRVRFSASSLAAAPEPQPTMVKPAEPEYETFVKPPSAEAPPPAFTPPPPSAPDEPPAEPARPDGPPPGVPRDQSTYLKYLPPMFSADDFIGRFLLIFESILSPISRTVDNLHYYFDPRLAPADMLPWLASWLGLVLDERWPEAQRRALIGAAVDLYLWRGTKRGLSEFLRLYTGFTPEIIETGVGRRQVSEEEAFRFIVRVKVPDPAQVDRSVIESIIDAEKPAHTGYSLEILPG